MMYKLKENRVWRTYLGGAKIDRFYGRPETEDGHFPEDWIASNVTAFNPGRNLPNEGLSRLEDGRVLKEVLEQDGADDAGMPILLKLLDAAERLVIQAHPTAAFAEKHFHSKFGKAECWYFLDCGPDAYVYLGFRKGMTREKWVSFFQKQDIDSMLAGLHRLSVKNGDLIYVGGGVPHAIGQNCMMLELQEPTDLMVIPERITPSGMILSDEKLHGGLGFDKMFDCFCYDTYTEEEIREKYMIKPKKCGEEAILIGSETTERFEMREICVREKFYKKLDGRAQIVVITQGSGRIETGDTAFDVSRGDKLYLSAGEPQIQLSGKGLKAVLCCGGRKE